MPLTNKPPTPNPECEGFVRYYATGSEQDPLDVLVRLCELHASIAGFGPDHVVGSAEKQATCDESGLPGCLLQSEFDVPFALPVRLGDEIPGLWWAILTADGQTLGSVGTREIGEWLVALLNRGYSPVTPPNRETDYQRYLREMSLTVDTDPILVKLENLRRAAVELNAEWLNLDADGNHPFLDRGAYPVALSHLNSFDEFTHELNNWYHTALNLARKQAAAGPPAGLTLTSKLMSVDTFVVGVPASLCDTFENAIQNHLTRPMRLKDGITISADDFNDWKPEDYELIRFRTAVLCAVADQSIDGYLFERGGEETPPPLKVGDFVTCFDDSEKRPCRVANLISDGPADGVILQTVLPDGTLSEITRGRLANRVTRINDPAEIATLERMLKYRASRPCVERAVAAFWGGVDALNGPATDARYAREAGCTTLEEHLRYFARMAGQHD